MEVVDLKLTVFAIGGERPELLKIDYPRKIERTKGRDSDLEFIGVAGPETLCVNTRDLYIGLSQGAPGSTSTRAWQRYS